MFFVTQKISGGGGGLGCFGACFTQCVHVHKTYKSGGVIISDSFGISICLKRRVSQHYLIFKGSFPF